MPDDQEAEHGAGDRPEEHPRQHPSIDVMVLTAQDRHRQRERHEDEGGGQRPRDHDGDERGAEQVEAEPDRALDDRAHRHRRGGHHERPDPDVHGG